MTVNGTRCCAKCKSPYGHVAAAGQCCHPVTSVAAWERLRAQFGDALLTPEDARRAAGVGALEEEVDGA